MNVRPYFHGEPVIFTVDWRDPFPRSLAGWRAPVRLSLNRSAPPWMMALYGVCAGAGMAFLLSDGPVSATYAFMFFLGGMTGLLMTALGLLVMLTWRLRARFSIETGDVTTVRLSVRGVETLGDLMETRMSWKLIVDVAEHEAGLILRLSNGAKAPVPANALPPGVDIPELRRRIRRWRAMAEAEAG